MTKTFISIEEAQKFYVKQSVAGKDAVLKTVVPGVMWTVTIL